MVFTEIKKIDLYQISGFSKQESDEFKKIEQTTALSSSDLLGLYSLYSDNNNTKNNDSSNANNNTTNTTNTINDSNIMQTIFESINSINYFVGSNSSKFESLTRSESVADVITKLIDNKASSLFNIEEDLIQLSHSFYIDNSKELSLLDEENQVNLEENTYLELDKQIDLKYHFENLLSKYARADEKFKKNPSNVFWGNHLTKSAKRQNDEFLAKLYFADKYDSVLYSGETFSVISLDILDVF